VGRFKEIAMFGEVDQGLESIADALGGEVSGRAIIAPSPARPAGDRTLVVLIDPSRLDNFYVYGCAGALRAAIDHVRKKLKLVVPTIVPAVDRSAAAMRIWNDTASADGTVVENYLRSRCITLPMPPTLRYHGRLWHRSGGTWPAMVALVTDAHNKPVAIHRTYLDFSGRKAPVDKASVKLSLGPIGGCAIRLAEAIDEVSIGEGIETALSYMQMTGIPAWSAISAVGLKDCNIPNDIKRVTILADRDPNGIGELSAEDAAKRLRAEGRAVQVEFPDLLKDFNEELVERTKCQKKP
jgi:hypothetical protein